jgi:acyl-CoA thioesterase FadM
MGPRTEWSSQVRLSELGPGRRIHPQRILEWFQDAAANASSLGGFPPDRYDQMGAAWIIREVLLELDAPLDYGEPFTVETWVSDLRRFRTRREYVVRAGESIRARGQADWLYLERDPITGKIRPRHVDEEMKQAFPIDPSTSIPATDRLPWREVEPTGPLHTRRVQPSELDPYDHANHTYYLRWLEDQAAELFPNTQLTAIRIEYALDCKAGEEIQLRMAEHADGYTQWITRGDQLLVRAVSRRAG